MQTCPAGDCCPTGHPCELNAISLNTYTKEEIFIINVNRLLYLVVILPSLVQAVNRDSHLGVKSVQAGS